MGRNKSQTFVMGSALAGAVAATGAAAAYLLVVRPWHLRWGANDKEVDLSLPGDELVPEPKIKATHAVTINASPAQIWPWLVQLGQGRGGFYSYDWIENSMGLDIHTTDRILPEFQNLKVGDSIPLAPENFSVPVAILEKERALVLHGDTRTGDPDSSPPMRPGDYINVTWGFYLDEQEDGSTRLIERWKADYAPNAFNTLFYRAFLEPGAFIMERKMLLGIKERVEAAS